MSTSPTAGAGSSSEELSWFEKKRINLHKPKKSRDLKDINIKRTDVKEEFGAPRGDTALETVADESGLLLLFQLVYCFSDWVVSCRLEAESPSGDHIQRESLSEPPPRSCGCTLWPPLRLMFIVIGVMLLVFLHFVLLSYTLNSPSKRPLFTLDLLHIGLQKAGNDEWYHLYQRHPATLLECR